MTNKVTKSSQLYNQVSSQYQSVVQELDQMLKKNQPDVQESKQPSEIYKDKNHVITDSSSTGVKEFDRLLDGGFPKGAVVLLAGSSGSGKTIFASQWLFEGVKNNENGIYITLTEPLFKILENMEKMSYYNRDAIEQERLKIVDMRENYKGKGKGFDQKEILDFIEEQVKQINAKRLCIDSITAIAYHLDDKSKIRTFIFELGTILATLGCTTILTSEVAQSDRYSMYDVEEFISDAILRLDQIKVKDEFQRVMRIVKVRGKSYKSEALPLKISKDGITVFPKIRSPLAYTSIEARISTGNTVLDDMLLGGVTQGSTTLVAGSTGTGKTLLCLQFIIDGLKKGEPCLYADFEESREQLTRNAKRFGWDLEEYEKKGLLTIQSAYPNDKLLEEHLNDIRQIVENSNIRRCVIDSLSSISHAFDEEAFSSFSIRLNGYLKMHNVTSFFTSTTGALIGSTELVGNNLSTITDSVFMLRYVEMQGRLESVINILKMRGSGHCKDLRKYDITSKGIVIGQAMSNYEGIMTGVSKKIKALEQESERLKRIIKEKEEAKKELQKSKEKYKSIFENSAVGVMLTDENEHVTSCNKYIENLLGWSKDDLYMRPVESLYPPEEWQKIRLEKIQQKGTKYHIETKMFKKNNEIVDVDISLRILKNNEGNVVGAIGVVSDITERRKAQEQYKILFNSSPDAIMLFAEDGKILSVNSSMSKNLGVSAEDLIGENIHKVLPKDVDERRTAAARKALETGEIQEEDDTQNGRFFHNSFVPIFNPDGRKGIQVIVRDITEQKKTEGQLKQSKQEINDLLNAVADGIQIVGTDFKVKNMNQTMAELANIDMDEGIGMNCAEIFKSDSCGTKECSLVKVMETGGIYQREDVRKRKDGQPIHVLEKISPYKDKDGKIIGVIEDFRDINLLKQRESELQEAQNILAIANKHLQRKIEEQTVTMNKEKNMYKVLLEGTPQEIFHKNKNFEYVFANDNFLKNTGINLSELVGKTDYDIFPKDIADKYHETDKKILETGNVLTLHENFVKNGIDVPVEIIKAPIRDDNGNIKGILGILWENNQTVDKNVDIPIQN